MRSTWQRNAVTRMQKNKKANVEISKHELYSKTENKRIKSCEKLKNKNTAINSLKIYAYKQKI